MSSVFEIFLRSFSPASCRHTNELSLQGAKRRGNLQSGNTGDSHVVPPALLGMTNKRATTQGHPYSYDRERKRAAQTCRPMFFHSFTTSSFTDVASPARDWISDGIMILVAWPFAAFSNASRERRAIILSLGADSLIFLIPSAVAVWT